MFHVHDVNIKMIDDKWFLEKEKQELEMYIEAIKSVLEHFNNA